MRIFQQQFQARDVHRRAEPMATAGSFVVVRQRDDGRQTVDEATTIGVGRRTAPSRAAVVVVVRGGRGTAQRPTAVDRAASGTAPRRKRRRRPVEDVRRRRDERTPTLDAVVAVRREYRSGTMDGGYPDGRRKRRRLQDRARGEQVRTV